MNDEDKAFDENTDYILRNADSSDETSASSKLLSIWENGVFFGLIGARCYSRATALIKSIATDIRSPGRGKIEPLPDGKWVAGLIKDHNKRAYFLRVYDIKLRELVWERDPRHAVRYEWTDSVVQIFDKKGYLAEVVFADPQELERFRLVFTEKWDKYNRRVHTLWNRYSGRRGSRNQVVAQPSAQFYIEHELEESFEEEDNQRVTFAVSRDSLVSNGSGKVDESHVDISAPSGFKHLVHVFKDPQRGLAIKWTEELEQFLKETGKSESELKLEDFRNLIMYCLAKNIQGAPPETPPPLNDPQDNVSFDFSQDGDDSIRKSAASSYEALVSSPGTFDEVEQQDEFEALNEVKVLAPLPSKSRPRRATRPSRPSPHHVLASESAEEIESRKRSAESIIDRPASEDTAFEMPRTPCQPVFKRENLRSSVKGGQVSNDQMNSFRNVLAEMIKTKSSTENTRNEAAAEVHASSNDTDTNGEYGTTLNSCESGAEDFNCRTYLKVDQRLIDTRIPGRFQKTSLDSPQQTRTIAQDKEELNQEIRGESQVSDRLRKFRDFGHNVKDAMRHFKLFRRVLDDIGQGPKSEETENDGADGVNEIDGATSSSLHYRRSLTRHSLRKRGHTPPPKPKRTSSMKMAKEPENTSSTTNQRANGTTADHGVSEGIARPSNFSKPHSSSNGDEFVYFGGQSVYYERDKTTSHANPLLNSPQTPSRPQKPTPAPRRYKVPTSTLIN